MMKTATYQALPISQQSIRLKSVLRRSAKRWDAALLVSLAFALLTGIFGLTISVFDLLGLLENQRQIAGVGVCLLIAVFAAAFFAAHCLDKAKEAKKALRENAAVTIYEHRN